MAEEKTARKKQGGGTLPKLLLLALLLLIGAHLLNLRQEISRAEAGTASDAFLRTLYSIFGWEGRLHRGLSFFLRKKVHAIYERFTQHAQKHNACERRKVERRAQGAAPTVRREEGKRDLTA